MLVRNPGLIRGVGGFNLGHIAALVGFVKVVDGLSRIYDRHWQACGREGGTDGPFVVAGCHAPTSGSGSLRGDR